MSAKVNSITAASLCAVIAFVNYEIPTGYSLAVNAYHSGQFDRAVEILRPLAEDGDTNSQSLLGFMLIDGLGANDDSEEAIRWWRLAAKTGDGVAQHNIAGMYSGEFGTEKNLTEAVNWYRRAAENGVVISQYNLAQLLDAGQGTPEDDKEAAYWYRRAAEQGFLPAQFSLAEMYDFGDGVTEDAVEAVKWYRRVAQSDSDLGEYYLAAKLESQVFRASELLLGQFDTYKQSVYELKVGAQLQLGAIYSLGRKNVPIDDVEAVKWYRFAAEAGDEIGQYFLAVAYYFGGGVPEDSTAAAHWYRLAAEQGELDALFDLAAMYEDGIGVEQNYDLALLLYKLSDIQGNKEAREHADGIIERQQLTLERRSQADESVKACYRNNFKNCGF